MKCVIISVVCCFWFRNVIGVELSKSVASSNNNNNNFTFTYDMAQRCKEHICHNGYSYDVYYKVDALSRKNNEPGVVLEMHLAILAGSNGHILLSTVEEPHIDDPVYEIVVGGGGNKFTELRRNRRRNARTSVRSVGILSTIDFRPFYIRITEDGVIEFGKEGDKLPLLSYNDVSPININYFSFAAWNGVEAKFLYDCPPPGDYNATAPDSQGVEIKMSKYEKLKRSLLVNRTPYLPPEPSVKVQFGVKVTSVHYDAFTSRLTTGIAIVNSWTDNGMAWNPNKYDNITRLSFRQGLIWRPMFYVYNAYDVRPLDTRNPGLISMVNSGEATFHFETQIHSVCDDDSQTYNKWPHDEYTCSILIGTWETHEKIVIDLISSSHEKMAVFSDEDRVIINEWDMKTKQGVVSAAEWSKFMSSPENQTSPSSKLVMKITVTRRAVAYNIVFYTPLLVLVTFVLLSFWGDPRQMSRVWFYAGCIVFICMGLCYMDYLVPCHTLPSIVVLYITVLVGVLIALLIQVVLLTSVAEKCCKGVLMQAVITSKWFRFLFGLKTMKTCTNYDSINEGYDDEEDSSAMVPEANPNVEQMQKEQTTYGEIVELAEAIDKLLCLIYSVTFSVMLAMHY